MRCARWLLTKNATWLGVLGFLLVSHVPGQETTKPGETEWKAPLRASRKKNPVPLSEKSIEAGKAVYAQHCLSCHGAGGKGDGPAAKDLPKKVQDLADPKTVAETEGVLFWKVTEGRAPMPSYEKLVSENDRWNVVSYMRALTSSPRSALSGALKPYFDLEASLAKDDLSGAQKRVAALEEAIHELSLLGSKGLDEKAMVLWKKNVTQLIQAVAPFKEAKEISALRRGFNGVSEVLAEAVTAFGHAEEKPLSVFKCPMAFPKSAGTWVQSGGPAQNPYLGSKMPTCGELEKKLEALPRSGSEGGK